MRVVALEEHFTIPSAASKVTDEAKSKRGFVARTVPPGGINPLALLPDLGEQRLKSMDDNGISVQVLSVSGPGAELMEGQTGIDIAKGVNDGLKAAMSKHPTRYAGFAHLPLRSPDASAKELVRCVKELQFCGAIVNGTTDGLFLDDARFEPVLAAAQDLDVPVYIHPHLPRRRRVRGLLRGAAGQRRQRHQHRRLGLALGDGDPCAAHGARGHLRQASQAEGHHRPHGRGLPVMLARLDDVAAVHARHLSRPISQTILEQVWLTTSGIFTQPPLIAALLTFGLDRIMFSVDYPYARNEQGKAFLEAPLFSPGDMAKFCHGTADALLKLRT